MLVQLRNAAEYVPPVQSAGLMAGGHNKASSMAATHIALLANNSNAFDTVY